MNTPPRGAPPAAAATKPAPDALDDVDKLRERFRIEQADDGSMMHIRCREDGCAGQWVFPLGAKPKDRAEAARRVAPIARDLGAHAAEHDAKHAEAKAATS